MIKLLYKPVDLIAGMIGGLLAGLIFKQAWKLTGRGNAPGPPTSGGAGERSCWPRRCRARSSRWSRRRSTEAPPRGRAGSPGSGRAMKASSPRSRPDQRQAKPCQIRARTREAQRSPGSHQEQREWRRVGCSGQIGSTVTPSAWAARVRKSPRSPDRTVPRGSATAMTSASAADPVRAVARSQAARRASLTGTLSTTSQVRRKRCCAASRDPSPVRHSARTIEGTTGGHNSSPREAAIRAAARPDRSARRVTAPEYRTSITTARC
jgi:hypothetical protein